MKKFVWVFCCLIALQATPQLAVEIAKPGSELELQVGLGLLVMCLGGFAGLVLDIFTD